MIAYTVEGRWPFPTDMLRYDRSRAATPEDEAKIAALSTVNSPDGLRLVPRTRIDLVIEDGGSIGPNERRWQSFAWFVVDSPFSQVYRQRKNRLDEKQTVRSSCSDPVLAALSRCKECWEDDEAADVDREKLDGLRAFGLLRKVGRCRWEITPAGMALLGEPMTALPADQEFTPHVETVRRCEEIARYFADHEFRNVAPGFVRGVAYASEYIACEISDLVPGAPRAPVIAVPDLVGHEEQLAPQDYHLLVRLLDENNAGGARPVVETNSALWGQALRLSDMGLLAIEQLDLGGKLHVTRLGTQLVKAGFAGENDKDQTND